MPAGITVQPPEKADTRPSAKTNGHMDYVTKRSTNALSAPIVNSNLLQPRWSRRI